jgi:hypothetical protein
VKDLVWIKATRSGTEGSCVQLAEGGDVTYVRDSKHPDDGMLALSKPEFAEWLSAAKNGEFDHLV